VAEVKRKNPEIRIIDAKSAKPEIQVGCGRPQGVLEPVL